VTFVVTAVSGSWQIGLMKDYVWGYQIATITAPGTYTVTTPPLPSASTNAGGSSTYGPMFWAVGNQSDISITIDMISINGVGAPSFADLAPSRRSSEQLLPPSRIVTDMQIPGDASIMLPHEESYVTNANPTAGTLSAHPWGASSFARQFSTRVGVAADLLTLSAGKALSFGSTNPTALAIIRYADQNDSAVTVNVNVNGSLQKTLTFSTVPFGNEWIEFIYSPSEGIVNWGTNGGLGVHQNFELAVSSGSLKVAALIAFTAEQDYLDYDEIVYRGTWTRGSSRTGIDGFWSDTVGDAAYVTSEGRRVYFEVSGNPGSKTADFQTDYEQFLNVDMAGQYHVYLKGGLVKSSSSRSFLRVATAAPGSQANGWSCHIGGAVVVYDR
jgi:hypothetical protein